MPERKKRKTKELENLDLSTPLDVLNIYNLGGANDPCFGKHHDLTAEECQRCGDSELCQIATQQRQVIEREKDTTPYMSKSFDNMGRVKPYIKRLTKLGKTNEEIESKIIKRFNLSSKEAKQILNNL